MCFEIQHQPKKKKKYDFTVNYFKCRHRQFAIKLITQFCLGLVLPFVRWCDFVSLCVRKCVVFQIFLLNRQMNDEFHYKTFTQNYARQSCVGITHAHSHSHTSVPFLSLDLKSQVKLSKTTKKRVKLKDINNKKTTKYLSLIDQS